MLPLDDYKTLVRIGVLPAIDVIVKNQNGEILLGKRANDPAKGKWFVPGGRIFKNESVGNAFQRIVFTETGLNIFLHDVKLLGIYEHIYNNNYFGDRSFNTHYLVMTFEVDQKISDKEMNIDSQHTELKFTSVEELLLSKQVHNYTKNYFIQNPKNIVIRCKDIH